MDKKENSFGVSKYLVGEEKSPKNLDLGGVIKLQGCGYSVYDEDGNLLPKMAIPKPKNMVNPIKKKDEDRGLRFGIDNETLDRAKKNYDSYFDPDHEHYWDK